MTTEPTGHLPECQHRIDYDRYADCICDRLRACEQRVDEEWRKYVPYRRGYAEALDAARDAVAALPQAMNCWIDRRGPHLGKAAALAAIDALQTSLSGPAAVRTSEPEPPTSVAPAGEDHGATIEHVDTCRTCRDEIEAEQPEPADPPPTHTCAIGNFADCEGCKWDATLTPPEPHLHYCDCPDCAFADQVSKAVHLLKTIGDITYTDEGLAIVARQIIRMGLRQALESVQGMRGLTLDGPRMQVHAEERIKRLLRTDTPAVAATPGGDDE